MQKVKYVAQMQIGRLSFLIAFLLLGIFGKEGVVCAQQVEESPLPKVSLLLASSVIEEPYTLYGHAGLRIHATSRGSDSVYNWGLFDFEAPGFVRKFVYGQTDYMIGVSSTSDYMAYYLERGSSVTELVLNMDHASISRLEILLQENMLPENRVYRYNFFYDNCATRPVDVIERAIGGQLQLPPADPMTFREMINAAERPMPWLVFGTDLAVASPADREATPREQLFLPHRIAELLPESQMLMPDGSTRNLVKKVSIYRSTHEKEELAKLGESPINEPAIVTFLYAFLSGVVLFFASRSGRRRWKVAARLLNVVTLSVAGFIGLTLAFLSFVSLHPAMSPNANLLFLHPFHMLVGIPLLFFPRAVKVIRIYHVIVLLGLLGYLGAVLILPQQFNIAFVGILFALLFECIYQLWESGNR